jgi:hypothetical protein
MISDYQGDETRHRKQFKIKSNFGNLRIGFSEPAIWSTWRKSGRVNTDAEKFMVKKYNLVIQRMRAMGAQVVFPIELPSQASLTIDGKNCFEPVVCKSLKHLTLSALSHKLTIHRLRIQRMPHRIHPRIQGHKSPLLGRNHQLQSRAPRTLPPTRLSRPNRPHGRSTINHHARRNQHGAQPPPRRRRYERSRLPLRLAATRHHRVAGRRRPVLACRRSRLPNGSMPAFSAETQRPTLRHDARSSPALRTRTFALHDRIRAPLPGATYPAPIVVCYAARAEPRTAA